jgi:hypothetical protein
MSSRANPPHSIQLQDVHVRSVTTLVGQPLLLAAHAVNMNRFVVKQTLVSCQPRQNKEHCTHGIFGKLGRRNQDLIVQSVVALFSMLPK